MVVEVELEIAGQLDVVGLAVGAGYTAKAFRLLAAAAAASTDWTGVQHEKYLTAAVAAAVAADRPEPFAVDSLQIESWQHLSSEYWREQE